jgi:hypothetical protein
VYAALFVTGKVELEAVSSMGNMTLIKHRDPGIASEEIARSYLSAKVSGVTQLLASRHRGGYDYHIWPTVKQ